MKVNWERTDLPRAAVKQDLLFTLGSAMSVFAPSKHSAIARLDHLLKHGTDPGQLVAGPGKQPGDTTAEGDAAAAAVDEQELTADIEQVAMDQITSRVAEEFAGHGPATLVTAILQAEGYVCTQSPPGPDGGTAGRGPLGLDAPRILAQVKSGGQIGVKSSGVVYDDPRTNRGLLF